MLRILFCFAVAAVWAGEATAGTTRPATAESKPAVLAGNQGEADDEQYIASFNQHFHKRSTAVELKDVASVGRYDSVYMGESLEKALSSNLADAGGNLAWSLSYRMISLNDMFRLTHDPKYLQANLRCMKAVMAVRDDRIGRKNFRGEALPVWTSDKYSDRGRTVFLVHTGMIVYPMLEAIHLANISPQIDAQTKSQLNQLLPSVLESLSFHARQWRNGPAADEGCYVGHDEEEVMEDKPQPANRLSAIGRCLWTAWLVTHDAQYRSKAVALGWYIKHRLPVGEDGAYFWPYFLSVTPATNPISIDRIAYPGEDTSHATLTVSFPIMLAQNQEVFTDDDMRRLAKTVTDGWARLGNGILFGNINGSPRSNPAMVIDPAGWLCLSASDPAVKTHILPFYLNYDRSSRPEEFAQLLAP